MFGISSTILVTLALMPLSEPAKLVNDVARQKLIVKEKAYFLHALLPATASRIPIRFTYRGVFTPTYFEINGLVLLHTSTATGEMKVLAAGGKFEEDSLAALNVPRKDVYKARIAGVATDRERIYVLRWRSAPDEKTSLHLLVFRADTGAQIHALKLKGKAVPEKEPEDTVKPGPLRLHADGVSCYGTRFELQGTRLIKERRD